METSLILDVLILLALALLVASLWWRPGRGDERKYGSPSLFSPTSRTIGGPGHFTGDPSTSLRIFQGSDAHVISVTLENAGDCDVVVRLRDAVTHPSTDISATVAPGETVTLCGYDSLISYKGKRQHMSTHEEVMVTGVPGGADNEVCRYRWRVDTIGQLRYGAGAAYGDVATAEYLFQ